MSKHKKIFHKKEENIPSADDILNYLKEDSINDSSKMDLDDMIVSPSPSLSRSNTPSPGIGGGKEDKKNEEKKNKNNKKKHELEKSMLSEPLVSDAVEGYALLLDKEKTRRLIADINKGISIQTAKKEDRSAVIRIAAMIIVVFSIGAGGLLLYNQISPEQIASVTNEQDKKNIPSVSMDSSAASNTDTSSQLAIDAKKNEGETNKIISTEISTDGYINPGQKEMGPSLDQKATGGRGITPNDEISEDYKNENPAPSMNRSQMADSVDTYYKQDQLAIVHEEESKKDKDKSGDSKRKSVKKSKEKSDSYAPSSTSKGNADILDDRSEGVKKKDALQAGIDLYNQNKFKEAKKVFIQTLQSNPSNMDAKWYLAITYIKLGKKEEAKTLLYELEKQGNPYSERAKEELKKLN